MGANIENIAAVSQCQGHLTLVTLQLRLEEELLRLKTDFYWSLDVCKANQFVRTNQTKINLLVSLMYENRQGMRSISLVR